ncbi:hypothetical protein B0H65DRAFT_184815 [Neurospora tetraspora]|uniref:Uncharacterized protein n=1 Tax=Neurospora tetraspora TaxID=94610 RepID=A0AAE0JEA4_9PEZI|nr:hypothetical protein B0H65DRAFT_184815 [Neurospora tetraspora]
MRLRRLPLTSGQGVPMVQVANCKGSAHNHSLPLLGYLNPAGPWESSLFPPHQSSHHWINFTSRQLTSSIAITIIHFNAGFLCSSTLVLLMKPFPELQLPQGQIDLPRPSPKTSTRHLLWPPIIQLTLLPSDETSTLNSKTAGNIDIRSCSLIIRLFFDQRVLERDYHQVAFHHDALHDHNFGRTTARSPRTELSVCSKK